MVERANETVPAGEDEVEALRRGLEGVPAGACIVRTDVVRSLLARLSSEQPARAASGAGVVQEAPSWETLRFIIFSEVTKAGAREGAENAAMSIAALTTHLTSLAEDNAKLRERVEELENLIGRIEPHIDAIVCYASTMGEHEPNRIAHDVRAIARPTQDQLVGEAIAAQIIARIDAAHPASREETGWLVELKGQTPSWSTLFAGDYDDHWTEESTKAIRFARKVDAEAWIAWHGWTEAFASEHIWNDGRDRSSLAEDNAKLRARVEEECAQLVENEMPATQDMESTMICDALERAAKAIRARSNLGGE